MTPLQAALNYAKKGFSVIPVRRDKRPFIKWEKYQTQKADGSKIAQWFSKWPNANVGIVTGKISGLTVLDADNEHAFRMLDEFLPDSLATPTATTPKGRHLYFDYTPKLHNTVRTLGTALDIRNDGGYVVAPPGFNENGGSYEWQESLSILDCQTALIPSFLLDTLIQQNPNAIKKDIYSSSNAHARVSLYNNENESNIEVTESNICNILTQGSRDDDIFRLANCLTKGGMPENEIYKYLEFFAKNCSPPFDPKEIPIKIKSALKRKDDRDRVTTQEIRDFIEVTSGNFSVTNLYHSVTLVTSKQRMKARVILGRLVKEGLIEKFGNRDGMYRKVEDTAKKIDLSQIEDSEFPVKLPLSLHEMIIPQPKNIVIFAGERNCGKSCVCLNVAKLNINRGFNVKYLTSEMGGAELKHRLQKFEPDMHFEEWFNVDFCECASNFQDSIDPDGLNIIDYLKVDDQFWLIGGEIKRIFNKLNKGIAVIAIQKKDTERFGVGGQFTLDEARLYVTLKANPPEGAIAKIEKAKNWRRADRNPNYLECDFKIVNGSKIYMVGDWLYPSKGGK